MAHTSFTLTSSIAAPPEQIRDLIAGIEHLTAYHPLIIGVKEIASDTSAFGTPRRRFEVTDRLPLGPLRLRFTYLATSTLPGDGSLYCEAFQSPGVHLIIRYQFHPEGEQTRIDEQCDIDAPLLLRGFVRRQARNAHRQTMAEIKRFLEHQPAAL
jgi:carbon monoxide dehydrogenase subunit G